MARDMEIFTFLLFVVFLISLAVVPGSKWEYYSYEDYSTYVDSHEHEGDYMYHDHHGSFFNLRGSIRKYFAYTIMASAGHSNVVCSPVSALMPLGKLLLGTQSGSRAQQEMLSAVGLKSTGAIKSEFQRIIKELEYLKGVDLSLTSGMFQPLSVRLHHTFKTKARNIFHSSIKAIDVKNPERTASLINRWVSKSTREKISHVISRRDITRDLSILLVTAVYFKGRWEHEFHSHYQPFHGTHGTAGTTMMTRTGDYKYIQSGRLNAQIVSIPYVGRESSLIVVLPTSRQGLSGLVSKLRSSPELLNHELDRMHTTKLTVTIPEFKIETHMDLHPVFERVNVRAIFSTSRSALTRISPNEKVYVSASTQKTIFKVSEVGTKGVVATNLLIDNQNPGSHHGVQFKADHPFLFFVNARHEQLFAGVVNNP